MPLERSLMPLDPERMVDDLPPSASAKGEAASAIQHSAAAMGVLLSFM